MKTSSVSLCLLSATLFAAPAFAQGEPPAGAPPPPPPAGEHHPLREEMLKRFDANHDGKLDEAERATARAEWQKRLAEHGGAGAWGPGGPEGFQGRGGPHEFGGPEGEWGPPPGGPGRWHRMRMMMRMHWRMMRRWHEHMLARFDANHDGKLDEAERATARKTRDEMRARFQERRKQVLERFDTNHDGRLDDNERKSLRDAWQEFLQQRPVLAAPPAPAGK